MTLDGQKQRNALTAAERAITSLGAGDLAKARQDADKAAELDQIGVFADLPGAVERFAAEGWEAVRAAVPPGPLQALIEASGG